MRSALGPVFTLRRAAAAFALLVGALGFAGSASAQQALCPSQNYHPPIQLRNPPPCGFYSWAAHPNPYCSYGFAAPWDRPGMPAQGAPLPPFVPGMPCPPKSCWSWMQKCCNKDWCKGPVSPYGYAPGGYVRSPRDYFLQPGY